MLFGQGGHKAFVVIGVRRAQFVIEMNHRKHNTKFATQLQQQTQQGDRVRTA